MPVIIALVGAAACSPDDAASSAPDVAGAESVSAPPATAPSATRPLQLTDPGETPTVDRSFADVDLTEIVFDTFDGGSVALADVDSATIDRLFDAIRPIDAPGYEAAAEVDWLASDDLVVGFVDPAGGAWAYPVRILNGREIVNDELSGLPVVITYCPLCGSGVVYDRRLGDLTLSFSNTSALFENDMVMVDRETGSYWWQVAGDGLVGELTGETLTLLPSQTTTFESWLKQHPDSQMMERQGSLPRDSFATYGDVLDAGRTPFPVSDGVLDDDRLAPSARVIVAEIDGDARAWATSPPRVVEEELGETLVTITLDGVGGSIMTTDGEPVPLRSAFWFSVISIDPEIELGG